MSFWWSDKQTREGKPCLPLWVCFIKLEFHNLKSRGNLWAGALLSYQSGKVDLSLSPMGRVLQMYTHPSPLSKDSPEMVRSLVLQRLVGGGGAGAGDRYDTWI